MRAAIFGAWYRLPVLVVIAIAIPLLLVGEIAASDARERTLRAEQSATTQLADRAATLMSTRITGLHAEVIGAARSDAMRAALHVQGASFVDDTDREAIEGVLGVQKSVIEASVERLMLMTNGVGGAGPEIRAEVPHDDALARSRPVSDYARPLAGSNSDRIRLVPHAGAEPTLAFVGMTPGPRRLVADVPLSFVTNVLRAVVGMGEGVELSDQSKSVLARVGDLSAPERAFSAVAVVSATGWQLTASRPRAAVDDLDGVIAAQRAIRVALALTVVLGAIVVGRLGSALDRQRNALAASLEQRTATAELLAVISRSTSELTPVFQTIADTAVKLCKADHAGVYRREGGDQVVAAISGTWRGIPLGGRMAIPGAGATSVVGRAVLERRSVHIPDVLKDPLVSSWKDIELNRTRLAVPILKDGEAVGAIRVGRDNVRPFSGSEIALVESFATQAAIAIENVRLFNETKEALEQQTATSEVLRIMAQSPSNVQPVLDAVARHAAGLCDAPAVFVFQFEGAERLVAFFGDATFDELQRAEHGGPIRAARARIQRRILETKAIVHVPDTSVDPEFADEDAHGAVGFHAFLGAPLIRNDEVIGTIQVCRIAPAAFSAKQISLLQAFADQAVIAIENVRLFHEIQDKSRQLEAASRHKSEFLANMSHELRTPLNAVIGFSDVLEQGMVGPLNAKQAEYVRDISSSGKHLLDLVNEILDLSKVEAGRMELEPSEFAVSEAVLSTFNFVRERAAKHAIELAADVPADLGTITADERKVRQVLLNLLSNAVKFTPDGGWIGVTARRENGEVTVSVRDTGIGIAPEDQPTVFEEFQQVGKATDRSREGTGLGLTLAKRFIELHGGRIWLESEVGQGSTFTFALPVDRPTTVSVTAS